MLRVAEVVAKLKSGRVRVKVDDRLGLLNLFAQCLSLLSVLSSPLSVLCSLLSALCPLTLLSVLCPLTLLSVLCPLTLLSAPSSLVHPNPNPNRLNMRPGAKYFEWECKGYMPTSP
jgi:hypothetical protein